MSLLSLQAITLSYGAPPLLDGVDLTIGPNERVCLLGRNGAGKSTLLRIIDGTLQGDSGERRVGAGMRIARLEQEAPSGGEETVLDVVASGLGGLGALVAEYYGLSHGLGGADDGAKLARMASIQQRLEADGGWEIEQRAERVITRLGLAAGVRYATLSGGLRRRVLLARALVSEPDLLLLDEPTNHLDIETIEWLEDFLLGFRGSLLFVTHDRRFLRRLATRILELDRGRLTDWPGDYENYLRRVEERANAEAKARERFDKRLAEEEVWIRQGVQARRTRNEGRVRALQALREARRERREGPGQARIRLDGAARSGRLVVAAEGVGFQWPAAGASTHATSTDQTSTAETGAAAVPVITGFDTLILRGDRVGIIGPNGVGKSTLLKLLLGQLTPTTGQIRLGTNLAVAYFDQLRAQLDPAKSVRDNLAGGSDQVEVGGSSRHVLSYLRDFLFAPERANQPVSALSGGERNRLLLARLFAQPANLLVLDEPTNDLDAETLDLLEELLVDFDGTLLLVSHDRDLLDHVVTSTLVLEGQGRISEYVGGYSDWLRQRPAPVAPVAPDAGGRSGGPTPTAAPTPRPKAIGKLSYKDQRELDLLPARIEALEGEQAALQTRLGEPGLYQGDGSEVTAVQVRLAACEAELATCYDRWEGLEARRDGTGS